MKTRRIHIEPSWSFSDEMGNRVEPILFRLLRAIHAEGRLTQAAKTVGISYRHGWNLLNKWGEFFGSAVVALEKGRGATLTPLGEKLLWAEQRVTARMKPQMDNLASEINMELQRIVEGTLPVLRMQASHGYAVALLPDFAKDFQLDVQYRSPTESLAGLQQGHCDVAGFHLPQDIVIPDLMQSYQDLIDPAQTIVIRFVSRQQGLMIRQGNPNGIQSVNELTDAAVKFINRQVNSGTRSLFDQLLHESHVDPRLIQGYDDQEFTHGAIAAYVAAGMAEVGFGVKAAACQFGLDFVHLATEDYLLLCRKDALHSHAVQNLLTSIRSVAFTQAIANLPGYTCAGCGETQLFEDYSDLLNGAGG